MAATRIPAWAIAPTTNYGFAASIAGASQNVPDKALIVTTAQAAAGTAGVAVADTAGNTYTLVKHATTQGSDDSYLAYCLSAQANSANIITWTCTGTNLCAAQGVAYDGGGGTWSVDVAPVGFSTAYATAYSASVTTTGAGVIVLGADEYYIAAATFTTTGVAKQATTPGASAQHPSVLADLITTAAQSARAIGVSDDNGGYGGKICGYYAAFKLAAGLTGLQATFAVGEARDTASGASASVATAAAAVGERRDTPGATAATAAQAAATLTERRDVPSGTLAAALAAAYAGAEHRDTLAAAALVLQAAVLRMDVTEAADAFDASSAALAGAQALLADAADRLAGQGAAAVASAVLLSEARDATAGGSAAALAAGAALADLRDAVSSHAAALLVAAATLTEAGDALAAGATPLAAGALYFDRIEPGDVLTAAASARALAAALLADAPDGAHGAASGAATAGAAVPERPDTFAAASSTQALAHLALAVIEARDAFGAVAAGVVLAGALLTEHDTLAAQALAVAQADLAAIDSADALAARLAVLPQFADVDPRYLATLAARAFLAATAPRDFLAELPARDFRGVAQARAFLSTLPARAYLAVLRMHTMTIDQTEEKDRDEPALLTFDFDQALPAGVPLTGAAIVGVAPLSGTDGELSTWVATLQPQVGQADATLPTGATVKAGRYAQVEFPAGAGLRGNSYKFRCKGATADAAIAPICPVIVPVV